MYEIYEMNVIMKRRLIALLVAVVVIISISLPAMAAVFKSHGETRYSNGTKRYWCELYGNEAGRIDRFQAFWILPSNTYIYGGTRDVGFGQRIRAYSAYTSSPTIGYGRTEWRIQ